MTAILLPNFDQDFLRIADKILEIISKYINNGRKFVKIDAIISCYLHHNY